MKTWFALLVAVVTSIALPIAAQAGPAPSVSVSLVCDRTVGAAAVDVQFLSLPAGAKLGQASLSCGPGSVSGGRADRQKVVLLGPANWANVSLFTVDAGGGCPGASSIPHTFVCGGATLTVR